mmetsp:Transcript_15845/g.15265  ORF Transcript_15845/g.15265 Transcript_15845/m.15265 type:complete len:89 (-) Transcript_15845:540-806(-)
MEDLKEFVDEYEKALKEYEQEKGVPYDESAVGQFKQMVQKSQEEEKGDQAIELGSLTEQKNEQEAEKRKTFPYLKLLDVKADLWSNLK